MLKRVSTMILAVLMMLVVSLGAVTTFAAMDDEAEEISVNSPVTDNLPNYKTINYY